MANAAPEVFATEAAQVLVEDGHGGAGTHSEPELWGLAPFQIVSLSMLVLLLIALFGAKVHKTIAGGLGWFFRFGPKWFIRVDLGIDVLGAGIVLRF